jgi:hypothetical protein
MAWVKRYYNLLHAIFSCGMEVYELKIRLHSQWLRNQDGKKRGQSYQLEQTLLSAWHFILWLCKIVIWFFGLAPGHVFLLRQTRHVVVRAWVPPECGQVMLPCDDFFFSHDQLLSPGARTQPPLSHHSRSRPPTKCLDYDEPIASHATGSYFGNYTWPPEWMLWPNPTQWEVQKNSAHTGCQICTVTTYQAPIPIENEHTDICQQLQDLETIYRITKKYPSPLTSSPYLFSSSYQYYLMMCSCTLLYW